MKSFFSKISNKVNAQTEKIKNKFNSVVDNLISNIPNTESSIYGDIDSFNEVASTKSSEFKKNKSEESKNDQQGESSINASLTRDTDSDLHSSLKTLSNNKLSEEASVKIKNIISIEEDDKDCTYNLQPPSFEEDDEDYEEEEEEEGVNDEMRPKEEQIEGVEGSQIKKSQKSKNTDNLEIFKKKSSENEIIKANKNRMSDYYVCHQILPRGLIYDVRTIPNTICCQKMRRKNNLLKYIGVESKDDIFFVNYLIFLDEFYLYFIKDHTPPSISTQAEDREFTRLIGKHHNIKKLSQILIGDFGEKVRIRLVFKLHDINQEFSDEKYDIKDLFFKLEDANLFFIALKSVLSLYQLPLNVPSIGDFK